MQFPTKLGDGMLILASLEGCVFSGKIRMPLSKPTLTRLRAYRPRIDSRQKQGFFFIATISSLALEPTLPRINLVLGVRRLRREAQYSIPSNALVKNAWNYTSTLNEMFV
jgi:hypothetical protein